MRRSAALLCAYGANLANAVFLRPGARATVAWPNPDARAFWPERMCVLHSCAAAVGLVIQSVDKPYYDSMDRREETSSVFIYIL